MRQHSSGSLGWEKNQGPKVKVAWDGAFTTENQQLQKHQPSFQSFLNRHNWLIYASLPQATYLPCALSISVFSPLLNRTQDSETSSPNCLHCRLPKIRPDKRQRGLQSTKAKGRGWRLSLAVECLPRKCKAPSWILSSRNKQTKKSQESLCSQPLSTKKRIEKDLNVLNREPEGNKDTRNSRPNNKN